MTTARFHTSVTESVELCHTGAERRSPATFLHAFGTRLRAWRQRARSRRQLTRLDGRALRDIGITDLQARDEWQKPFWRP